MMAQSNVSIKGNKEGILISFSGQISFPHMKRAIVERLAASEAFLVGAHVSLDLGQNYLTEDQLDLLAQILADNGMILTKVTRGTATNSRVFYFDFGSKGLQKEQEEMWVKETTEDLKLENGSQELLQENTILFQRTLRSGQSIKYPGNVVIVGDVNPGAEIIAGENIIVMGNLRGIAHAGASGNEDAVVTAFRLLPTQLRIANHITRAPDGEKVDPQYPEIARIRNGMVVIELYQPSIERPIGTVK
ncbi:MAG: septum site-determining protein MinC [Bacillota bacterium]|nr:septum site-determining protein MinC [Bacillota bacterium]